MVRKFTPPARAMLSRFSICLPIGMKDAIERVMLTQEWSLKKRSNWIAAACDALLAHPEREDLVREEFYDGKTAMLPLNMDSALVKRLDDLAEHMTTVQRSVDRSSVIRTAITQAILAAAGRRLISGYKVGVPGGDTHQETS